MFKYFKLEKFSIMEMKIRFYKTFNEYAAEILGNRETNKDKHCLALNIRDLLNRKKIDSCRLYSKKDNDKGHYPVAKSELEAIAITMSSGVSKKLKIIVE